MIFSRDEIKRAALTDTSLDGLFAHLDRLDLDEKMATGAYGDLTLSEFIDEVYGPVRKAQQSPKNWTRERDCWKVIERVLGRIRTKNLNKVRWDQFLAGMTERWSPRTKTIAQQHYKRVLNYAKSVGAIEKVHDLDPIEGGNDVYGEPGDSLTADEVPKVLAAAPNHMHRTLFATAIGQGTRPSEVVKADWADVDWAKR